MDKPTSQKKYAPPEYVLFGHGPGLASQFIHYWPTWCIEHPGGKVVIFSRLSTRGQQENHNHSQTINKLKDAVESKGLKLVGMVRCTAPGWSSITRLKLREAAQLAQEHGAVILAESTSRFVRNKSWKPGYDAETTLYDFERLEIVTDDVPLVTLEDPDKLSDGERSVQTKRGMYGKGKHGGRPRKEKPGYKKRIRIEKIELARELRAKGMSYRKIADTLHINHMTVYKWLNPKKHKCKLFGNEEQP